MGNASTCNITEKDRQMNRNNGPNNDQKDDHTYSHPGSREWTDERTLGTKSPSIDAGSNHYKHPVRCRASIALVRWKERTYWNCATASIMHGFQPSGICRRHSRYVEDRYYRHQQYLIPRQYWLRSSWRCKPKVNRMNTNSVVVSLHEWEWWWWRYFPHCQRSARSIGRNVQRFSEQLGWRMSTFSASSLLKNGKQLTRLKITVGQSEANSLREEKGSAKRLLTFSMI